MLPESDRDLMFSNALEGHPRIPNLLVYNCIQVGKSWKLRTWKAAWETTVQLLHRGPHLVGRGPSCQGQDLISQADAENWCVRSMLHDLRKSSFFKISEPSSAESKQVRGEIPWESKFQQICPASSVRGSFASNLRIFEEGIKRTSVSSEKSRS